MDNNNTTNIENQKQAFNFLTEIYEVMKCFENNPSKLGSKINELKMKFEKARSILSNIPGIDMSHTEQQEYYQTLLKQYKRENELFNSYKDMCKFDISKLDRMPDLSLPSNMVSAASSSENGPSLQPLSSDSQFNFNSDNQNQQLYNPDENLEL